MRRDILKNMTKQEIMDEVSKYEGSLKKIHEYVGGIVSKHLKNTLVYPTSPSSSKDEEDDNESSDGSSSESSDDSSADQAEKTKKRKRAKRAQYDTSEYFKLKVAKRANADDELIAKAQEFVKYLNDAYGNDDISYKVEDSNRRAFIRIIRSEEGKDVIHCLIGKSHHDRKNQSIDYSVDGDLSYQNESKEDGYVVHRVYNEDNELVVTCKVESIKPGDVLKATKSTGSPQPIPAVKGNIVDGFEDLKPYLSATSILSSPAKSTTETPDESNEDDEGDETDSSDSEAEADEDGEDGEDE